MNRQQLRTIADAVLQYDSSPRTQHAPGRRWNSGVLYPPEFYDVRCGRERSLMQTECLLERSGKAWVAVELRFMHLAAGQSEADWEKAENHAVVVEYPLSAERRQLPFRVPASRDGAERELSGSITINSEALSHGLTKLNVRVQNTTLLSAAAERGSALLGSMQCTHLILRAEGGEFVSLIDPPQQYAVAAAQLHNVGNFPVLLGEGPERNALLCAPMFLYDYPQACGEAAAPSLQHEQESRLQMMSEDELCGAGLPQSCSSFQELLDSVEHVMHRDQLHDLAWMGRAVLGRTHVILSARSTPVAEVSSCAQRRTPIAEVSC
jgi:hydrogenase maturation protease